MSRKSKKRKPIDKVVIIVLVILLLISEGMIAFLVRNRQEDSIKEYEPVDLIGTYDSGDNFYFQKLSKKIILIAGLNEEDVQYVLLVAVDEDNRTLQPIQINRDVLCEHNVLDEFGKIINRQSGPIRDSYKGAADTLVGLVNVKDAVTKLMCNARIDYYMSINLLAADKITEIYDGIDVSLYKDYTDINPNYLKNTVVTIRPEDALDFVVGNESVEGSKRIEERINLFVNGFYDLNQYEYQNNSNYFADSFAEVSKYCLFNSNDFIDYASQTIWYQQLPIIVIGGEEDGSDTHVGIEEIEQICIDTIYK